MPTAINPPLGVKHSESAELAELAGTELLLAIRPKQGAAGEFENVNVPAELVSPPTNSAKSGQKFYRYRTRAEADAPGADGGAVLEEQDYTKLCTFATFVVERWRDNPDNLSEQPRFEQGLWVYDGTPGARKGYRDGSFSGDMVGLTPILLSEFLTPVVTINVPLLDPTKTDNLAGTTVHYPINGQERQFIAANNGGPFAAPTDEGGTNNWIPVARQVPPTALSQAYDLPYARYVASGYSDAVVVPGRLYVIAGPWNGGDATQLVSVQGVRGGFATTGTLLVNGVLSGVRVNVAAGTFTAADSTAGGAPQWVAGKQTGGALVYDLGVVYRVKADIGSSQSAPGSNPANYERVSGDPALLATHTQQIAANTQAIATLTALGGRNRGPWAANTIYKKYDWVIQDGATYYANTDFTSGTTFAPAKWTAFGGLSQQQLQDTLDSDVVPYLFTTFTAEKIWSNPASTYLPDSGDAIRITGTGTFRANIASSVGGGTGSGIISFRRPLGLASCTVDVSASGCTVDGSSTFTLASGDFRLIGIDYTSANKAYTTRLFAPGTPGTTGGSTIFTGTYQAPAAGAQTITKAGAVWFGSVGISTAGGKSILLAPGPQVAGGPAPGYTFVADQLTILDTAGVQANYVITYEYATGAVSGGTASVKTVNGVGPDAAGNVTVPTSGGAAGIDYANPVTLTAAAPLEGNKSYYVTGAGYSLTLPDPAQTAGKAIFIKVAAGAAGLYPISGSDVTLYADESIALRSTLDGWDQTGGRLLPMALRLETTLDQQDAITNGQVWQVPLSTQVELSGPPALRSGPGIVIQRGGRGTLSGGVGLKSNQNAPAFYVIRRLRAGVEKYILQAAVIKFPDGFPSSDVAQVAFSLPIVAQAGDVYDLALYVEGPFSLRGVHPGSQCVLAYLETI